VLHLTVLTVQILTLERRHRFEQVSASSFCILAISLSRDFASQLDQKTRKGTMNHIIGIYRSCPNIWLRNPTESHGNCASNKTRTRECLSPLVQFERLQGRSTPSNGNVHWHMMIMTLAFYGNFDGKILIIQLNQTWPSFKQTQPWSANSNGCVAQPLFQAPTAIPVRCHHLAMNQKSLARWILNSAGSMGLSSLQMWYHSIS